MSSSERIWSSLDRWQIITLLNIILAPGCCSWLINGFGTFIAKYRTYNNPESMSYLNFFVVLAQALFTAMMLCFLPFLKKISHHYQIVILIGYLLISASCFASAYLENLKLLFLTFSVLAGVGSGSVYAMVNFLTGEYFPQSHGLHVITSCIHETALQISTMGSNPLTAFMIDHIGVSSTYVVYGVVFIILGIVFGIISKPVANPSIIPPFWDSVEEESRSVVDKDENSDRLEDPSLREILSTAIFYPWILGIVFRFIAFESIRFNLQTFLHVNRNFSLQESSNILFYYGVAKLIMGLICTLTSKYFKGHFLQITTAAEFINTFLLFLWSIFNTTYLSNVLFAVAFAIFSIFSVVYLFPASIEVTGWASKTAWSTSLVAASLGAILSPLNGGLIYDVTTDPQWFFYAPAIAFFLSALSHFVTLILKHNREKSEKSNYVELK